MCNKIKLMRAAVALQEPSILSQRLFYFILLHIKPHRNKINAAYILFYFTACRVLRAINVFLSN